MRTDFADAAKNARATIGVPALPWDHILTRARDVDRRDRRRAYLVSALCVAIVGLGAATGDRIYEGVHLRLSGGAAAVAVDSLVIVRQPMESDVRSVAERATFQVVFPVGIPSGAHVTMLQYAPPDHPSSVTLDYRDGDRFNAGISLFDSSTVIGADAASAQMMSQASYSWRVGGETVVVPRAHITARDADLIKARMLASSPSASLDRTSPLLSGLSIQGDAADLAPAVAGYARNDGKGVLLDTAQARAIPSAAKYGGEFRDTRIVDLNRIPTVNGEPDYSKATVSFPGPTIITPGGVKAIAAVIREHGCDCAILFYPHDAATYWVWTVPARDPRGSKKYAVDATTYAVVLAR